MAQRFAFCAGLQSVPSRLLAIKRCLLARVRAQMPAAYEGACTRYAREREVRYSGGRFRSKLLRRNRVGPGC